MTSTLARVLTGLAGLWPGSVDSDEALDRQLAFLDAPVRSDVVVRTGYTAGLLAAALAGLVGVALGLSVQAVVLVGAVVGTGVVHAVHRGPAALAAVERTRALCAASDLVGRIVLHTRLTAAVEPAVGFAARTGTGPLARSLDDHVRRAAGTPASGLDSFAAAWQPWFPALERAYRVNLTLRTQATLVETEPWPRPRPPRPDVTLVNESVTSRATVEPGSASLPTAPPDATRLRAETRHVAVRHLVRWTWKRGNATFESTATVRERYAVDVAVDGSLPALPGTPDRPVVPVFEEGGALDGPNLGDVPPEADGFLAERGGVRNVAATRVLDGPDAFDRTGTVTGDRPTDLREWVTADLLDLNRAVRNTSTSVRMGDAATGRANPSANLTARLATRREALVDAPTQYDGAADRARVAARAAYLARVDARLSDRSDAAAGANDRLANVLRERHVDLSGWATEVMSTRTDASPDPYSVGGPLGGEDAFVPQGGPPYLDVQGVERTDAAWSTRRGTEYPLRTRNVNVFTAPYGDAVDAVFATTGEETVRLHTAAVTLRAAERVEGSTPAAQRDALDADVSRSLDHVGDETRTVLRRETTLLPGEWRRAVDGAFATWNRTSARAHAVTTGSFVPRVVSEAALDEREAARVRVHLRAAVAKARDSEETRVDREHVDGAASAVRQFSKTAATEAVGTVVVNGTDRLAKRTKGKAVVLPAGLPLLPTPTNWYATVNVWDVHVRGYYPRFAVRTTRGGPGETVTYVRDGGCATLDIDEDGGEEKIGCASRVDISVRTVVLVAVPPGRTGLGDTDGQAVEDSPGWDEPYPWEENRSALGRVDV